VQQRTNGYTVFKLTSNVVPLKDNTCIGPTENLHILKVKGQGHEVSSKCNRVKN